MTSIILFHKGQDKIGYKKCFIYSNGLEITVLQLFSYTVAYAVDLTKVTHGIAQIHKATNPKVFQKILQKIPSNQFL